MNKEERIIQYTKLVLGFRGVPKKSQELEELELCYRCGDGEKQAVQCEFVPA